MITDCEYVCSRGILQSCTYKSSRPTSSIPIMAHYSIPNLQPGESIYVCSAAIHYFVGHIAPHLRVPFVLVSGDSDVSIPENVFAKEENFTRFIENPLLIKWFSQNANPIHPKIVQIPIGLDYHTLAIPKSAKHAWGEPMTEIEQETLLQTIAKEAPPLTERIRKGYSNFQFSLHLKHTSERKEAIDEIPASLVFYEPRQSTREQNWRTQSKYAFVVSPRGAGLDCHRTWEAIALGCIPIVKTGVLDPLYREYPILIVQKWSDMTLELLEKTVVEYSEKTFSAEKWTLAYWTNQIREAGNPPSSSTSREVGPEVGPEVIPEVNPGVGDI